MTGTGTHMWLKRLRLTPKSMWMIPRITDIFILKELRKVSLLVAMFQICYNVRKPESTVQRILKWKNTIHLSEIIPFYAMENSKQCIQTKMRPKQTLKCPSVSFAHVYQYLASLCHLPIFLSLWGKAETVV